MSIPENVWVPGWSLEESSFYASIANRIWARFLDEVLPTLHNFLGDAYNPGFLRYSRIPWLNWTSTCKHSPESLFPLRLTIPATRGSVSAAEPYYFSGPVLHRMSAEQIWDSLLTLMVKDPMAFRSGKGSTTASSIYSQLVRRRSSRYWLGFESIVHSNLSPTLRISRALRTWLHLLVRCVRARPSLQLSNLSMPSCQQPTSYRYLRSQK